MTAAVPSDPGASHAEAHAAVFRAAGELFARQGFPNVTIREIAARAGTSPALVMKVGCSKRELFLRTATIDPPPLPDVPLSRLGQALVGDLVERFRRDDIEHLSRAVALKLNAPDPQAVRERFLAGYVDPLTGVLQGPDRARRAELAVAALIGLATTLRFFEPPSVTTDLSLIEAQYGPVIQQLLDGTGG